MGIYLNPGNGGFSKAIRSEIYVDKTGLISYTNKYFDTEQQFICIRAYHDIGERAAWEIREICEKRLKETESLKNRICGTETAKRLWMENICLQEEFYRKLLVQMEQTREEYGTCL